MSDEPRGLSGMGGAPPAVVRSHLDNSRNISLAVSALLEALGFNAEALGDKAEEVMSTITDAQVAAARELREGIGATPIPDAPARPPIEPSNQPKDE